MKLTIYLNTCLGQPKRVVTVDAEPVDIDPRMKTCVHQTPFDPFLKKYWVVSEVTTGFRIGPKAPTREEAIANATAQLKVVSDERIRDEVAKALNRISDIGEFIAFENQA